MDLTPRKPSKPWWSLFGCCHPSDEKESEAGAHGDKDTMTASTTVYLTKLKDADPPDTPMTACTDCDLSFDDSQGGDASTYVQLDVFTGDIAVHATPRASNKMLAPRRLLKENEGENSGPDAVGANCWGAHSIGSSAGDQRDGAQDDDLVPDIDVSMVSNDAGKELKFYQFMCFMLLRHMFGSWLPELDPTTRIFHSKLLLTQCDDNDEQKEDGSLNDMFMVDE